ncbi:hypothetical protein V1524DRAFT_411567 [Lipomyces starkeyi]
MSSKRFSVADQARQSHRSILITGGGIRFRASFFKKWATAGANVIIGDVDDAKGESIVRTVRTATDNRNHHYLHSDVTDWQSQVNFFKQASKISPHGGIDAVVANAGVADVKAKFNEPENLDMDYPPKPDMRVLDVNLVGVLYTTHLALFYLPRNPGSEPADPNKSTSNIAESPRDRHLLLIGSMASLLPIPQQTLYGAAKHECWGSSARCGSRHLQKECASTWSVHILLIREFSLHLGGCY